MSGFKISKTILISGLLLLASLSITSPLIAEDTATNTTTLSFIRPSDVMTLGQKVRLSVDKAEIAKLEQDKIVVFETTKGKHKLQTKVGFSIGVPNVTGFNGAKKFTSKVNLKEDQHFFKIVFKAALMGGKHRIIEIDQAEYEALFAKI